MTGWKKPPICVLFTALGVLGQTPDTQELQLSGQADALRSQADTLRSQSDTIGLSFQGRILRIDSEYDDGARALDKRQYEAAVAKFNSAIDRKSPRFEGALYWKAYALNRLGRRDEALAALATLRRDFPNSRWLNDAQALEAEVKQGSGQAVSPAQESNEDLKLLAINSLMNTDPERAMPLLEGILKGSGAPNVKERALFVLTQSRAPGAQRILIDYAKGAGNPDLQLRAIRYLGMSSTPESQKQLTSIYAATQDAGLKREILQALMNSRGTDALFNLAKSEKNTELRAEGIRDLGVLRASDQIGRLYAGDNDPKTKRAAVDSLAIAGDAKVLVDLARAESDPAMKRFIVQRLSGMHNKEATDYMIELLK